MSHWVVWCTKKWVTYAHIGGTQGTKQAFSKIFNFSAFYGHFSVKFWALGGSQGQKIIFSILIDRVYVEALLMGFLKWDFPIFWSFSAIFRSIFEQKFKKR